MVKHPVKTITGLYDEAVEKIVNVNTQQDQSQCENASNNASDTKLGISIFTAAIFVVGEMAGSGVLALPRAVVDSGWTGVAMIIIFCVNSGFSGTKLGMSWTILEERYEEYKGQVRNPYPCIGEKAFGKWGRILVSVCIDITQFGVGTVFLLLSSQLVADLLKDTLPYLTPCEWILVIACFLWPLMWFGTPKDFWLVAIGALLSTLIACVLIFVQIILDYQESTEEVEYPAISFSGFFLSFGTVLFSFGGAAAFPTIQNDMKRREKFPISVVIAFIILLLMYIPVAVGGYLVFGDAVDTNVLLSLSPVATVNVVNVLLALHLIFAFVIVTNPFCQDIEGHLKIPFNFTWRRCLFRSFVMLLILFVAESIPHFGKLLNLIGGSTITLLTFVFPPLFYMKLSDMKNPDWPERRICIAERIYLWVLICVGIAGGAASTYNAILAITNGSTFTKPCYLR